MLGSHGWGAHHCGPVIINPQLLGSSYWLQTMGVPLLGCSPPPFRRCVGSVLGRLRRCGMLISAPPSAPCRWQTWPCTPTSPKAAPPPPCAVSDPPQNTPLLLPFSIPKMVTHPRQPPQQAPLVTPPICFLYGFPPPPAPIYVTLYIPYAHPPFPPPFDDPTHPLFPLFPPHLSARLLPGWQRQRGAAGCRWVLSLLGGVWGAYSGAVSPPPTTLSDPSPPHLSPQRRLNTQ